jgi:hypothetical protein
MYISTTFFWKNISNAVIIQSNLQTVTIPTYALHPIKILIISNTISIRRYFLVELDSQFYGCSLSLTSSGERDHPFYGRFTLFLKAFDRRRK